MFGRTIIKPCVLGLAAPLALAVFAATSANADVIALYDFEDQDLASNDANALSTAGDLSTAIAGSFSGNTGDDVPGLEIHDVHTDQEGGSGSGQAFDEPVAGHALVGWYGDIRQSSDLQYAIDNDFYLSFTLTPTPGGQIDLSLFRIAMDVTGGTADTHIGLFSSVDGFASAGDAIGTVVMNSPLEGEEETIDLSGEAAITSATEFRIYLVTPAGSSLHGFALDNITLEGTAVPEPGSLALLGLGGLCLLGRRRNRA